ncbi:hypothetical protein SELMODRAFT_415907 [Selaginella moellendorffii]|uniref:Uncharacterized protein n=1 Tax=Selaginella moellendorffii TaxID=88036 RepID=D8RYK2_SELML|nr:hypothetical protein SELMODRAFT_415907 [Selaginella moellendorffii]
MALWWGLLWSHGRKSRAIMPVNTGTDQGAVILLVREEDERIGHVSGVAEVEREVDVNSFFGQASTFEQDAMRVKHGHEVQAASKIGGDVLGAEFIAGLEETLARRRQWIDRCARSLNIHFKLLEEGDSGNTNSALEKCEKQDESDHEEEEKLVTDLDVTELSLKKDHNGSGKTSGAECIIFIEGEQIEGDQLVRTPRNLDSMVGLSYRDDAEERNSQPLEVEMVESGQVPCSQIVGLPPRGFERAIEVHKRAMYHASVHEHEIADEDEMRRRRDIDSYSDILDNNKGATNCMKLECKHAPSEWIKANIQDWSDRDLQKMRDKGAINRETKMVEHMSLACMELDFKHVPASLWECKADNQDGSDGDLKGSKSFLGQASTIEQDAMRFKHGHEIQAASKIGDDVLGAEFVAGLEEKLARRRQWIDRCARSLNIHFKLLEEGDSGNTNNALEKCEEQDESDHEEEETLVTSSHRDSLADLGVAEISLKATAVEEVEKTSEECIIFIEGDQIEGDQLVRTPKNLDSDNRMVVLSDAKERKSQPLEVEMVESDQVPRSQILGLPRRQKRDHLDWESAMEVSRLRKRVKYHAYHIDYYDAQLKENSIQAWRSDFSWLVHEPAIMDEDKMRRRRESHIDFFNGYTAELENYYKGAINSETKMVLDFEHVPASLWEWIEPDKQDWRDGDLKGMRHDCNSFSSHASTIKEDATKFKPGHEIQPASKNGGDVLGAEFIAGLEETLARRRQWMDWCARSLDIHFKLLEKEDSAGNTGNALENWEEQDEKPVTSSDSEMIKEVADLEVTESSLKGTAVEEAASSRINELDVVIAVRDQAPASAVEEVANHDQAPVPSRHNEQGNLDVVIAVQEEVPLFLSGEDDRDGVEKTSGSFPPAAEQADLLGRLATWFGGRRRKVDRATCGLPSREDGPVHLFYDHKDDCYKQLGEFYGTGKVSVEVVR